MATWEEIRKLAADLQRVQTAESVKRLSENNCVEIINKLIEMKLIDVIHTIDGSAYITRQHLATQIRNECIANNGNINLTELPNILNVGFHHIEESANAIVKSDPGFVLSVGQLISREYLANVCDQINEWLSEDGSVTFAQISKRFNLPADLLREVVYDEIGKRIQAHPDRDDPNTLYTNHFMLQQTAVVRGFLTAVSKPTVLSKVASELQVKPAIFFKCLDELLSSGQLRGSVVGGHSIDRAVFTPESYTLAVSRSISDFYLQNGFIEYQTVSKMGNADAIGYLRSQLPDASQCLFLNKCALSPELCAQTDATVIDSVQTTGWADIPSLLPLVIQGDDVQVYLNRLAKQHAGKWVVTEDDYVYAEEFITECSKTLEPLLYDKAEKESAILLPILKASQKQRVTFADKDDDDDFSSASSKKKGGKAASGKKDKRKEKESNATTSGAAEFISKQEIVRLLSENLKQEACPDAILEHVAERLYHDTNAKLRQKLESVFLSSEVANKETRKKTHADIQEQFRSLFYSIFLFDLGTAAFDESIASQLRGLLLRGYCSDLLNLAVCYISDVPISNPLTPKVREETIANLNGKAKPLFEQWAKSLSSKDLSDFFSAVDAVCQSNICPFNVRNPDKKLRAELVNKHRAELLAQFESNADAASQLLLALQILFCDAAGSIVYATGKFVPQLMAYLRDKINNDLYDILADAQKLVVQSLKAKQGSDELNSKMDELKQKLLQLKKPKPAEAMDSVAN